MQDIVRSPPGCVRLARYIRFHTLCQLESGSVGRVAVGADQLDEDKAPGLFEGAMMPGLYRADALGPSGLLRFAEPALQVMGKAGAHQVDGARVALSMPTAAAPSSSPCGWSV